MLFGLRKTGTSRGPMIRVEQLPFGYNCGEDVLRLGDYVLERDSNILACTVGTSGRAHDATSGRGRFAVSN